MLFRKILVLWLLCGFSILHAQDKHVVMGKPGDYYIAHKVAGKESLSGIGRLYGFTARQLAQYNKLNPTAGLPIDVVINIPLTPENLGQQARNEYSVPVYHMAKKGDNLFRLSQQYYKVPVALLRSWNDLNTDVVKDGQAIIIGFINAPKSSTPSRVFGYDPMMPGNLNSTVPVVKTPPAAPLIQGPAPLKNPNVMDAAVDGSRELKGEMKPLTDNELLLLAGNQEKSKKAAELAAASAIVVPGMQVQAPLDEVRISDEDIVYTPKQNDEGYFGVVYAASEKSGEQVVRNGEAGIFKTLSGLTDRKFYVLMNDVFPGTIVRITASNKKIICARVLGALPEIKGAEGLLIRMSTAAAAALGMQNQTEFNISITYQK